MADSPAKAMIPDLNDPGGKDDKPAACLGTRAVAEDRILETKRDVPVIPAERTVVFTG